MLKVVVSVKEEIIQAAERRKAAGIVDDISSFLSELIDLGFERRLQQLYEKYEAGEISFGYFAKELGLSIRDLYAALEERALSTSNIGAKV